MSLEIVQKEIEQFLRSDTPEVLCISGGWGVGKTFAWKKLLQGENEAKRIALKTYAYVSMFGLNSLEELKKAIFHNTIHTNSMSQRSKVESIAEQVSSTLESTKKHIGKLGSVFGSKGTAVAALIEDLSFAAIDARLVCFDDLERAGEGLAPRDILGLANFLKEERRCKVAILLNIEQLAEAQADQFRSQFEKVVDIGVLFNPDAEDACRIALNDSDALHRDLASVMQSIGCNNIRLIKRAEKILGLVHRDDLSDQERFQFAHTVGLATFIHFGDNENWNLEQLKSHNSYTILEQEGADQSGLREFLAQQNYAATDELDLVLIEAVENGYSDQQALASKLDIQREYIRLHGRENAFSQAWDYFHNSLDHNPEEFCRRLTEAVSGDPEAVSLSNFNGTLRVLDELGFAREADELASRYFEARNFDREQLIDDVFLWRNGESVNPRIIEERDRLVAEFVDERDPVEVVQRMVRNSGWSREDWQLLNRLSEDEIVSLLDGLQGEGLTSSLQWLARFRGSEGDEFQPFGERLSGAVVRVAGRSESVRLKLRGANLLDD